MLHSFGGHPFLCTVFSLDGSKNPLGGSSIFSLFTWHWQWLWVTWHRSAFPLLLLQISFCHNSEIMCLTLWEVNKHSLFAVLKLWVLSGCWRVFFPSIWKQWPSLINHHITRLKFGCHFCKPCIMSFPTILSTISVLHFGKSWEENQS